MLRLSQRLTIEITKLVSEMKNGQETESHLSLQLASERKNTDSTSKSLSKCESLLQKFTEKNEQLGRENTALANSVRTEITIDRQRVKNYLNSILLQVIDLKEHLKESQKREDVLAHDLRSLTDLLRDTQHNLRLSHEKVLNLTVNLFFILLYFNTKFLFNSKIDLSNTVSIHPTDVSA